jgi:putative ABC transport system ATP-binding protein
MSGACCEWALIPLKREDMNSSIVRTAALCRNYGEQSRTIPAVNDVSLLLTEGEFVALVGPSGCGKSSLLNMIGLVDRPTSGELYLGAERVDFADEKKLLRLRRTALGYVFQQFNLLPTMTALENVLVPLFLNGSTQGAKDRAYEALVSVGVEQKADAYPSELSGGEMQRVACARAVVHSPLLVIADEPTGNLDSHSGERVLTLLQKLASRGTTVLMATHSNTAMEYCSRIVRMKGGAISP